ncbi:MAG: hypothetical protein MUF50_00460 [Planctomycetes bacterium]|jgi:hypothetical protein|nr:hypothetical protein [Planctomycetota bacterium]
MKTFSFSSLLLWPFFKIRKKVWQRTPEGRAKNFILEKLKEKNFFSALEAASRISQSSFKWQKRVLKEHIAFFKKQVKLPEKRRVVSFLDIIDIEKGLEKLPAKEQVSLYISLTKLNCFLKDYDSAVEKAQKVLVISPRKGRRLILKIISKCLSSKHFYKANNFAKFLPPKYYWRQKVKIIRRAKCRKQLEVAENIKYSVPPEHLKS